MSTLGLLDHELRQLIRKVLDNEVVIIDEGVVVAFLGGLDDGEAAAIAQYCLHLAERLSIDEQDIVSRLIHMSLADPEPGVRSSNTKMLVRRAIWRIRERLGRRSALGALSLADGREGSLSIRDA